MEKARQTYKLVSKNEHLQGIRCLVCGMISFNPNDVVHQYCGHCQKYHADRSISEIPSRTDFYNLPDQFHSWNHFYTRAKRDVPYLDDQPTVKLLVIVGREEKVFEFALDYIKARAFDELQELPTIEELVQLDRQFWEASGIFLKDYKVFKRIFEIAEKLWR